MKVKEWKTNGRSRWVVDGRQNGKRKRIQFDTKTQAETWLKAENKDTTQSAWWLDLKNGERADIMNAFERSREMGFSLLDAVHYYGVQGRGKTFLKKMSLKEAVGDLGGDKRFKDYNQGESRPSGFLAAKARKGCTPRSLSTLGCVVHNFMDFVGGDTQCATITPEDIEDWLDAGGIKGSHWKNNTKLGYTRDVKNLFNWLIRQDVLKENPVNKIEQIMVGEFEPQILTVDQSREFMEVTREHDPELLTAAALNLFCGIRPSEVRRLGEQNISIEQGEVELKGKQTKTRRKRFVDMSDNCVAWMKLGAELPISNLNPRWSALTKTVKAKWGIDKWPHDCLRHSFCSYYLAHHEDAAKTALQAGHTESVLFQHYRKMVRREDAEKFWGIFPRG